MAKEKEQHRLVWNKKAGRHRCAKCGLVALKNERTKLALHRECPDDLWDEDNK